MDEDALDSQLVYALRSKGFDVLTAAEADMLNTSDDEQLDFATKASRVLFTYNRADFCQLHWEWTSAGRSHSGVIVCPQIRFSVGEQVRRMLILETRRSAVTMIDRLEFLSNWT